jgi:catechol 2,3-dioxygenase-like lactoylglutathione lyase family enzyme
MHLGNFSISLAVKDIKKSKEFYQNLGFEVIHGNEEQGWLILKHDDINIGIFQGMFEHNILTFNPGWDSSGKETEQFTDVREIQKELKKKGIKLDKEAEEDDGPAYISFKDPDGNEILIDQHRNRK